MEVANEDRISRFLFASRWFARTTGRVKPEAFIPHPHVELSVSCTQGLEEAEIWLIGQEAADRHDRRPTLHGRADVIAGSVRKQSLRLERDDEPRYHANILGWEGERSAQISKAQQIAADAKLVFPADS